MIRNFFENEMKELYKDGYFEHCDNYYKSMISDINHAERERLKTIERINSILNLCTCKELETLYTVILGACEDIESLSFYGR